MIGGHRLGTAPFTFDSKVGPFYRAFLISLVWLAVAAAAVLTFIAVTPDLGTVMQGERADPFSDAMLTWTIYAVIFLGLFPASAVYSAFIHNVIVNGTTLDGVDRFRSSVSPWRLVWILLSNAVVVVVSLGLMLPWTHIRVARYLAAHTRVIPGGSIDDFVSGQQPPAGAVGDAFTDIEGFDAGLAV